MRVEDLVARGVAEAVVQALEVVDVDEQDRERLAACARRAGSRA